MAYSETIKKEAKRLYLSSFSCNDIAEKLSINPDTIFRWRNSHKWDEDVQDESLDGLKKQLAAIASSEDDLSDAQARKIDKLAKAIERMERSTARAAKGAKGKSSKKDAPAGYDAIAVSDLRSRALDILYPYQRDFYEDYSRFRLLLKSRQTGFSFLAGLEVVTGALSRSENQIVVSASQDQSDIVRGYAVHWCERLGVEYLEDGNSIILPGGKRGIFLPCNPRTVQGYTGDLLLDEFAWHLKNRQMWQVVVPIATQGRKRVTVISTPYTETDMFGELVVNAQKYNRFSRHTVDIHRAIRDGLDVDLEDLRSLLDDISFAQAYECKFFADQLALLSPELVRGCIDEDCLRYVNTWVNGGVDIGRYRDLTEVIFVEQYLENKEKLVAVRHMDSLKAMSFDGQKSYINGLLEEWKVRKLRIDATGIGLNLAEDMQTAFPAKVIPVHFTREKKEAWALGIRRLFEQGGMRIPNDRDLIMQLHAIKRKPTERGFTYDADRNEQIKHADKFWALGLAVEEFAGGRRVISSGSVKLLR